MEKEIYEKKANIFKALSDSNRLQIIDMLSCGEMCACNILEKFNITQPTLSHHMRVLSKIGLINSYKNSNWIIYSLNQNSFDEIQEFITYISTNNSDCICKKEAKINNLFHKAIHLWIMIGDKVLIQQRSENKKKYPDKWDISVAGHIVEYDSSINTVIKELHEELNIEAKKEDI